MRAATRSVCSSEQLYSDLGNTLTHGDGWEKLNKEKGDVRCVGVALLQPLAIKSVRKALSSTCLPPLRTDQPRPTYRGNL